MNQYLQILFIWVWNFIGTLIEKWNYVKTEYRKKYGDWRWIDLQTAEPQILHIYFVRPGMKLEHWCGDTYKRWNARLREKKPIRVSEWYLPQHVYHYNGIVIHYRFRQNEWYETCNWVRGVYDKADSNPLTQMRKMIFPRWNSETWKSSSGRVKFPAGFAINGQEREITPELRGWFGPEGRREKLVMEEDIPSIQDCEIKTEIVKRNFENWFDLTQLRYVIDFGDTVKLDWGITEEIYKWGTDAEEKKEN